MIRGRGRDSDVLGVARHGAGAAVAMILLRGGRVVGKECRVLAGAGARLPAEILETFLAQHYLARREIPRRIWVGEELSEAQVLAEALASQSGHPVEIRVAQRGRGVRLVRTAERNAAYLLEDAAARRAGRRARFAPDVLELQRALALESPPYRMVCFDISNLGAEGAVAAVVANENGVARRGLYRRMRIRQPGPDDVAMIREAVQRYWARVESDELPRPDLVVVDGGVGQVRAARAALDEVASATVPLIGIAKREETVVRETASPLRLSRRSGALKVLQRLRDEAHRFGLAYHRNLRRRARLTSDLDRVPGVGPARRARLLYAFGSLAALRAASAKDIVTRTRLPQAVAERVVATLAGEIEREADRRQAGGA
jgi:excinuclease ABC subunit C